MSASENKTYMQRKSELLNDPLISDHLKAAIRFFHEREPIDAFQDAALLSALMMLRCSENEKDASNLASLIQITTNIKETD